MNKSKWFEGLIPSIWLSGKASPSGNLWIIDSKINKTNLYVKEAQLKRASDIYISNYLFDFEELWRGLAYISIS